MQTYGVSTELRNLTEDLHDEWEAATRDGTVTRIEIARITRYIHRLTPTAAHLDDAVRTATSVLKIGTEAPRAKRLLRDVTRLHGPVRIDQYRRNKKRQPDCGPTDAA